MIFVILYTCTIHQVTFEDPSDKKFAALWDWMNKRQLGQEWPLGKRNTRPHEQSAAAAVAMRTEKEEPKRKKRKQQQGPASAVAERESRTRSRG